MLGIGDQTMELNRERIIKALECFHQRILNTDLAKKITESEMMAVLDAIALINELTEDNKWSANRIIETDKMVWKLKAENERLRADTVREMQERLEERLNRNSIFKGITMSAGETVYDVIDQIAKEMVEEN